MTTLSEIVKVEKDVLYRKFNLEPWYYDPHHKENVVFLSPTALLDDRQLRNGGGYKDRGPKEVWGRLTKDILAENESKQHCFFQVPEIPYFHMGYGKTSENKRNRMALTENEGKEWMESLDLTQHKKPGEVLRAGETPMEEDVTFPTPERPEDYHAFEFEKGDEEELVDPKNSGLKRRVKGSYLLFFSILLIFFKKKNPPSAADYEEEKIGANKVSDFLLFWILPYLLNFTQQKVNAINAHHAECKRKSGEEGEPFQVPTLKKSAMEIIERAFSSCNVPLQLEHFLKEKLRKYYSTPQLSRKYNLPETRSHTPIILVPLDYKVTDMPVKIEDIGTKWQEIGKVTLCDEFINKFINSKEIQTDFLHSFGYLTERFSTDYGIILPDEASFTELISKIEDEHPDILREIPQQGRSIAPRLGLVKDTEKNQSVCFSYFSKEHRKKDLFRLIGSHRLSHFTIIMLYGSSINPSDPDCELLSLYPVKAYRKRLYDKKQGLRRLGEKTEGKFCSLEFPETLKLWEQELCSDELVMKVAQPRHSFPKYEHSKPLQVVYTTAKNQQKLKKEVFGAAVAPNLKALEKCLTRAANLNGCLLQDIARRGRLKKVALVLAINDTLGPDGACWPSLENATRRVISHFIQAVIVAGLPSVYPHNSDEDDEDDEGEESDSSEEELDETSDDEQPSTSGVNSSGESGFATSNSSFKTAPRVKEGIPTDDELHELAHDVKSFWKKLGRELKVENPMLAQFDLDNPNDSYEKAYQMLTHWRESNADSATYQILFEALNSRVVGRRDLAKKYCEAT